MTHEIESVPKARCKTPDCRRLMRVRGICQLCYNRLALAVKRGAGTWQQFESEGRCDVAKPRATFWKNSALFKKRS
jgi:hypothetical protein